MKTGKAWMVFAALLATTLAPLRLAAMQPGAGSTAASTVPAWLFPQNPPESASAPSGDDGKPVHLPGSEATFTKAQLADLFHAPDWHPRSHTAMPAIVAVGRPPGVYACGYCHSPGGQGRPENAALAGLPAAYIRMQVADFKSGARKSAWHDAYLPSALMSKTAANATLDDISAAADYFSAQSLQPRVKVVESLRVPRSQIVGWVYARLPHGGSEPLGQRMLEFAPDPIRHEHRDDALVYTAYVPPGSIARGKRIAHDGTESLANACQTCHGPELHGVGSIPPLAGRSPTYILRQLYAFQTGARAGAGGEPMRAVVKTLALPDMIAVTAYASSLAP